MYYNSLYYVFLLLNYFSYQCFAIHCGGGSVLRSELFGGPQDDSIISVNLDNNKGFRMAGQTSDGTWTGNSIGATPPDYWVAAVDTATNQSSYRLLDVGQDNLNNAYLNEYYLCIAGASDGLEYIAVWPSSLNISSTPTWSHMGIFTGLNSEEARAVVCTSTQALLVSAIDSVGNGKPDVVLKSFSMQGDIQNTFTYGGSDKDVPHDSALSGSVLAIVGQTLSTNFNVTPGATQTSKSAGNDAFVMTVDVSNGNILFATYYGGNGDEYADAVALDEAGYVYVCGYTSSQDLVLPNAYSTTQSGISDAWLGIWSPAGTLVFATLFGSDGSDQASQIQVMKLYDSSHLVYMTGITDGTNFPSVESFEGNFGLRDAFVLAYRVAPDYSSGSLSFSTRFGGSGDDLGSGLSVNQFGQIAIGGSTKSSDFPGEGVYQANFDAFYTVFDCPALIPVPPSPTPSSSPSASPVVGVVVTCQTADGCYQAQDLAVKYEQTSNGTYTPTQTLYPVNSTSNSINNGTSLNVAYNVLEEKDANGTVIHSVNFPSDGWQLNVTSEVVGGTSVSVVSFTTVLASGANVTIYNYLFEQDTTFTFANISFPVYASSTESNIKIEGWPFQSEENSLQLKVDLQIVPAPAPAETSVDGSITQYAFDTGVSKAQVSVLSVAVVDDASAQVATSVSSTQLSVNFPYFAKSVVFDPGYSVLVNNEGDKEPKKQKEPISKWAYIGAAIGVVVIAAIFTGFLLTFMKKRQRRQRAKSRAAIQHATEQMNGTNSSSEVSTF